MADNINAMSHSAAVFVASQRLNGRCNSNFNLYHASGSGKNSVYMKELHQCFEIEWKKKLNRVIASTEITVLAYNRINANFVPNSGVI